MRKRTLLGALVLLALLVTWFFLSRQISSRVVEQQASKQTERPGPTTDGKDIAARNPENKAGTPPIGVTDQVQQLREESLLKKLMPLYLRSIDFYGKVVDERGTPIAGAKVAYRVNDSPNPDRSGSTGEIASDAAGLFAIGARGLGIYVEVSKEGYYRAAEVNGQRGSYAGFTHPEDRGSNPLPERHTPAIFTLRKMGDAVPLVHIKRSVVVAKDGTPTEINLATGEVNGGGGHLRIEVWTLRQGTSPTRGQPYDWECSVSVPGGGLAERKGQFDFEARQTGYVPSFETGMKKDAERWQKGFEREFFVQLADGRFARLSITLTTGGDHFVTLESHLNPKPGARNLEFDPKQQTASAR